MKRTILLLTCWHFTLALTGQIHQAEDGLFYDKDQQPFNGTYTEYYDNGQVKQEMTLIKGKIEGQVSLWYRSGLLKETRMFKDSLRHGIWISYNEEGHKTGEAGYKDGLKDGRWRIWDTHGTLRCDIHYRNGLKSGIWIMYDPDGKKLDEKNYSDEKGP